MKAGRIGKASRSLLDSNYSGRWIWIVMDASIDFFIYVENYLKKKKGGYFETTSYNFFSIYIS
jgi:hypothetical protein